MRYLRSLSIAVLLASVSVACLKNDEVEPVANPQVNYDKTYTASTLTTSYIHMAVAGKLMNWPTDSVKIKPFLNRITDEGKNPGFHKQNATLQPQMQTLSFNGDRAFLNPGLQAQEYKHLMANYGSLLWLIGVDTLTIPVSTNSLPKALTELGVFKPTYFKVEAAAPEADEDYQIRVVPEQYASLEEGGELKFPGIRYYLKTKSGWESYGYMNNALNQPITQYLQAGDTLLVQIESVDFK